MAIVSCKRVTGSPNIHFYPEADAATANMFQPGDLVKLDTASQLVLATDGDILGIVQSASTSTNDTEHAVDVLMSDSFSIPWTAEATTIALVNDVADVTFTTGAQVLTGGGTTDCVVVGFDDEVGTSGGRVLVKIIPAAQQFGAKYEA